MHLNYCLLILKTKKKVHHNYQTIYTCSSNLWNFVYLKSISNKGYKMDSMIRLAKIRPKSFLAVTDGKAETDGCEHTVFIWADVIITGRVQSRHHLWLQESRQRSNSTVEQDSEKRNKENEHRKVGLGTRHRGDIGEIWNYIHCLSVCTGSIYLSLFILLSVCLSIYTFLFVLKL